MGTRIPRPDEPWPRAARPSAEQVVYIANFLIGQIVEIIRSGNLPPDDRRRVFVGYLPSDRTQPVIYPMVDGPWADPAVAAIVARQFRAQGWTVRVVEGQFGILLPKDRFRHLLR